MKLAVTGGSGGIGRAVVEMARSQGHQVVSIDRITPAAGAAQPGVTFTAVDVTNYADFEHALRGCEALAHLAAISSPGHNPDHEVHNNNVVGSYNALRAAAELGINRVCQASSVNATGMSYSRRPHYDYFPLDEHHPTYNEDPYSLSKWICEQQGDSIARRCEKMSIASLRFHWVLQDRATAVQQSAGAAQTMVKQLWSYTRLDAAARACLQSLTAGFPGHQVFQIIAPDTMMDEPSLELKQRHYPDVPVRGDLSGRRSFFDCNKAERMLGWRHDQR
jgi:nucleoside-diphosphate-sugar epimerase